MDLSVVFSRKTSRHSTDGVVDNMASVTYLNIAVKVLYWLLFEEVFRGPALMSTKGFFYWTGLQCFSWAISFVRTPRFSFSLSPESSQSRI